MEQFILDKWDKFHYNNLISFLKDNADLEYKDFHSKLVPTLSKDYFIGIRMPFLRKLGKAISKGDGRSFLSFCCDDYYEESMLYGIVLGNIKTGNFDEYCKLYDGFVEKINNWAVCDCCSGKSVDFNKYKADYFSYIEKHLNSSNPWEIRYAVITMFNYKEDEEFLSLILARLKNIKSDFYYVKMAVAWLTAELYAFHKKKVYDFLLKMPYDKETTLMVCSKIRDSRRVNKEDKAVIKEYKQKYLDNII